MVQKTLKKERIENGLDKKEWVVDYITRWIEFNTKFKVINLEIGEIKK